MPVPCAGGVCVGAGVWCQGGVNNDRVGYISDTIPRVLKAQAAVPFTVTVRNNGWNVIPTSDSNSNATRVMIQVRVRAPLTSSAQVVMHRGVGIGCRVACSTHWVGPTAWRSQQKTSRCVV